MSDTRRSKSWQPGGGLIGLSFSGGGFRATAFSLGTMTLLQDLGLLAKAKVMSSVSGGSLALAAYLCAKAGSDVKVESDFRFDDHFYQPLMDFLEGERLAQAFLNLGPLLDGEKLILKAADATDSFLKELLKGENDSGVEQALLGNEKITDMLGNENLSPDFIFFNATNITSLDLFRFGIQRAIGDAENIRFLRPIFVLNRYFLKHSRDSAEGKILYHHAQKIRLADCVAASFCFPGGFEPLLFPDDFFRADETTKAKARTADQTDGASDKTVELEDAKRHFRGDLICDHKPYLAFLDGGLYDNLGLASVEDIRHYLSKSSDSLPSRKQSIHYVIATDVDQIPTQFSTYSDPEEDRLLKQNSSHAKKDSSAETRNRLASRFGKPLQFYPIIALFILSMISVGLSACLSNLAVNLLLKHRFIPGDNLATAWTPQPWALAAASAALAIALWFLLVLVLLWLWLGLTMKRQNKTPRNLLGLSDTFAAKASQLQSWWQVARGALTQLLFDPQPLWYSINDRRIGQLLPAFNGYLKRTRSLTYGYLQQAYKGTNAGSDCHLIRNMIFELTPGEEVDPDYAAKLITLPIRDYRHEERLDPVFPIVRKISRARIVSEFLQTLQEQHDNPSDRHETVRLSVQDLDLEAGGRWTRLDIETEAPALARPEPEVRDVPLMLILLTTEHGQLLPEARQIIDELNLETADQIWRWICNNLACFDDEGDNGCRPAHPHDLSIPISGIVAKIRRVLDEQIRDNEQLRERCLVSLGESTSSYSWIPLICEMATNVPTTLWLKGSRWYTPNRYADDQRISSNGQWSTTKPKGTPDLQPLDMSALGEAPAAAICTVAGYVSTGFNLLEYFYAWLGDYQPAQAKLLDHLKQEPFPFSTSEKLRELEALPYSLRHNVWQQLKAAAEQRPGTLTPTLCSHLALLEGPLNQRHGVPESYWAERDEAWEG